MEILHRRNVVEGDRNVPKWVHNAIRKDGVAILVFKKEVQDNGYVIIRGKEVELDFQPKYIQGAHVYSEYTNVYCYGMYTYKGEEVYDGFKDIRPSESEYELFDTIKEEIFEDKVEIGEFGEKKIYIQHRIRLTVSDGVLESHFDTTTKVEPIGRKVVSISPIEGTDEFLSSEKKQWRPSSAFAMGMTTDVTVEHIKRKFIRTFEDGETDTIEMVVTIDPRD